MSLRVIDSPAIVEALIVLYNLIIIPTGYKAETVIVADYPLRTKYLIKSSFSALRV